MFKDFSLEVMLSKSLVGKAPPEWGRGDWREFYKSFQLTRLTCHTLAGMIWKGYSFTPPYKNGRRIEENFVGAQHIAFDFDSEGAALEYLMRSESLAWTFANFAYSTPSSTPEQPKSRVVFILLEPITDPAKFRLLYQALAAEFELEGSRTDPSCKDPLRLYYGSPGCEVITNWSALTPETVEFFIERYQDENRPVIKPPDPTVKAVEPPSGYIEGRINGLLENIVFAPDGEKHNTVNKIAYTLGGYAGAGYIGRSEAIDRATAAIRANGRAKDLTAAIRTIEEAVNEGIGKPITVNTEYKRDLSEIL